MPKKISVDEIIARRSDLESDVAPIVKSMPAPPTWNKDRRTARFVMNSQAVDRYGDVVVTAGIDLTHFENNPIALLFHASRSWPIGTWSDLQKVTTGRPPRLEGTLNLLPSGGPVKEIDETAWMLENGGIRACSIGFRPDWDRTEMILDEDGQWTGGLKYIASELLEGSVVPLPASPQSLAKAAGGDMRLARELVEYVLDTYARTPEGLLIPMEEYRAKYMDLAGNPASVTVKDMDEPEEPEDDPDDPDEVTAGNKAADASWACHAARDLAIDADAAWDGAAAKKAMLDDAGIGGDNPDHAKARRGFLAVDTANPDLRGSYKLPFANIIGGDLKAVASGIRAAASRLPQTDIPDSVKEDARAVLDAYEAKMDDNKAAAPLSRSAIHFAESMTAEELSAFERDLKALERGGITVDEFRARLGLAKLGPASEPEVADPVTIHLDTTDAENKLNGLAKLADTVSAKLAAIFGRSKEPERVEPPLEAAEATPVPTAEAIEAVMARAAEARDRLARLTA